MAYHISTTIIIFVPLIFTFLWLYYKVARLIWRHRKPLSSIFHKKEENSTTETSITHLKVTDGNTTNTGGTFEMHLKKLNGNKKNIHAEKKIQTFRIIIVLIVIYVLLRLPYHIFNILKVVGTYNEPVHWVITYLLTGFVLLNCALNPFLYTFLKSTIRVFSKVHRIFISDFLCKVCCCCCTNAEFEEFERENPFTVDTFDKRSGPSGLSSFKSNSDKRNSRVKFNENLEKCEEGKKDRKY